MKEKIKGYAQVYTLFYTMIMGFWFTYALIWKLLGLPLESWALWTLFAFACLSEYGYYLWVRES